MVLHLVGMKLERMPAAVGAAAAAGSSCHAVAWLPAGAESLLLHAAVLERRLATFDLELEKDKNIPG